MWWPFRSIGRNRHDHPFGLPRAGRKLFDLRRSLTEVYQDMVDTFGVSGLGDHRGGAAGFKVDFSDDEITVDHQQTVFDLPTPNALVG